MRESKVERHLVARVEFLGGECAKWDSRGNAGRCDRIVMFPDKFGHSTGQCYVFLVELKAPGKVPRMLQLAEHRRLRNRFFKVFVLDTIEKVDEFLGSFEVH